MQKNLNQRSIRTSTERRHRFYIISEILSVAKDGANKTRIMYQTRLTYIQTASYLELLLDMGLLGFSVNKTSMKNT